jgi:hypothetical protein
MPVITDGHYLQNYLHKILQQYFKITYFIQQNNIVNFVLTWWPFNSGCLCLRRVSSNKSCLSLMVQIYLHLRQAKLQNDVVILLVLHNSCFYVFCLPVLLNAKNHEKFHLHHYVIYFHTWELLSDNWKTVNSATYVYQCWKTTTPPKHVIVYFSGTTQFV